MSVFDSTFISSQPIAGPTSANGKDGLRRVIGVRQLTAAICNCTIGAGIFLLPGAVYREAGPAAPLFYLVCGVAILLVMTCFAIVGSRVDMSGGPYAYVKAAFGPGLGFMTGFLFCASAVMAVGALARTFAETLAGFVPAGLHASAFYLSLCVTQLSLVLINIRGVTFGSSAVELITAVKLFPLVFFALLGLANAEPSHLLVAHSPPIATWGSALLIAFWSMSGGEIALQPGEEFRQCRGTVPRAIFLAVPIVVFFYLLIHLAAQGVLGAALGERPADGNILALAAAHFAGTPGRLLLTAGAAFAILGFLSGDMLATPRSWMALARDGFLPSSLSRIHSRFKTPHHAILFHSVLILLAALTGTFEQLLKLSGAMILLMYLLCCAAAWRLHRLSPASSPVSGFFACIVPWLACLCLVWILSLQTAQEWLVAGATLVVGFVYYFFTSSRKRTL